MITIITGAKIITEKEILMGWDVILKDDIILDIKKTGTYQGNVDKIVEANGDYIMPGLIDIHSDMIENMIQPRSTAMMGFDLGISEAEKILAGCGITTMFHSISMYSEGKWEVKEIRKASQVKKLASMIQDINEKQRLIRHRYHLRYEIDNLDCYEDVKQMVRHGYVHLLSFMDHTPLQGQYKNLEIYKKHQPNEGKNITNQEFDDLIKSELEKEVADFTMLKELADLAISKGISISSHDDDTIAKLRVNKELGVKISEFPITLEVAKEAVKEGFLTVLGAPNILLGGSHSGNLSALDAIEAGAGSILVSDYYPQALLRCIFVLADTYQKDLCEMTKMVTLNPAKAVGISKNVGSIEPGKKADLLMVHLNDKDPQIRQVYVDGICILDCNYRD